ncbi:MAG: class I SAM-dependent methyltransferase [Candidatus Moranbacteria bacterium]|nr:class I SAM-dependent methyltransferase [Candidatus Moranbacteria bacterium]
MPVKNYPIKNDTDWWPKLAIKWKGITDPVRPSRDDLEIYDKLLRTSLGGIKKPKILVLGSTPEMRDLAHKYDAEVTIVDINIEMMIAMSELMEHKSNIEKEIWIKSGWDAVPLAGNYFDAILGDAVSSNMPWEKSKLWMAHMATLLKKSGVFIERAYVHIDNKNVEVLIDKLFKRISAKGTINKRDLSILQILLLDLSYDDETKIVININNKINISRFKGVYGDKFIDALYQKFNKLFPDNPPKMWRAVTENEQDIIFSKDFKIIDKMPSGSFVKNFIFYKSIKK